MPITILARRTIHPPDYSPLALTSDQNNLTKGRIAVTHGSILCNGPFFPLKNAPRHMGISTPI